jgi:hypothetical protein
MGYFETKIRKSLISISKAQGIIILIFAPAIPLYINICTLRRAC